MCAVTEPCRSAHPATLNALLIDAEREGNLARQRASTLAAMHLTLARIAGSRSSAHVAALVLRCVHETLGFQRAIYATVENATLGIGWRIDRDGTIEPSSGELQFPADAFRHRVGLAGELSAPLVDVRHWYACVSLRSQSRTIGVLYADDHAEASHADRVTPLHTLARVASVAIENGRLLERLHRLADRDPLTGVLNRRAFAERLAAEINSCKRSGKSLAYVVADVDDFKAVNDAGGHPFGDIVLQTIAYRLQRHCRSEDVVARFGGDEFVVLLVDVDATLARCMLERLSQVLRAKPHRCSIGAALFPSDGRDAESLFGAADRALYRAKTEPGASFVFASDLPAPQRP